MKHSILIRSSFLALAAAVAAPVHAEGLKAGMDPGHTFYFPTALQKPKGTTALKGYYLGLWDIEHTFSDGLSAGVAVLVPLGAYVFAPFVKPTIELGPKLHLGAYLSVGTVSAFSDNDRASYMQGGGLLTIGDEEGALTVGFLAQKAGGSKGAGTINLSGFYPVTDHHMLILEAYIPRGSDFGLVGYGLRYGGDTMSADVGFAIPVIDEMAEFLSIFPLGFPFISLNFVL